MIAAAPLAPDQTALLLVDLQEEYFRYGGPLQLPDGPAALREAALLLDWARRSGARVVHVRHVSAHPWAGEFRAGSPGVQIRPEVAPVSGEPVVDKQTPSAFAGTRLREELEDMGVSTVVVAGFMTGTCCTATAHEALALRYRTVFCSDATAALGSGPATHRQVHERALEVQRQIRAEVLSATTIARLMAVTA